MMLQVYEFKTDFAAEHKKIFILSGSLVPQNITASATGPNTILVRFEKLKQNLNQVKEFLVSVNDTFLPMNTTLTRDKNKVTFHNLASGTTHAVRVSTILKNGSLVPAEPVVTNTPMFSKFCFHVQISKYMFKGRIDNYNYPIYYGQISIIPIARFHEILSVIWQSVGILNCFTDKSFI